MTDPTLSRVIEIVTAWRNGAGTELTAARQMLRLAELLGVDVPEPVAGRVRRLNACHASADHVRENDSTIDE